MKQVILVITSVLGFILIFSFSSFGTDLENVYDNYSIMQPVTVKRLKVEELTQKLDEQNKTVQGVQGTKGTSTTSSLACPFGDKIVEWSSHYGIDPLLTAALISQESDFQQKAMSTFNEGKGSEHAYGLTQITHWSWEDLGEPEPKGDMKFDVDTNLRIGLGEFKKLLDRYSGKVEYACASYNGGWPTLDAYIKGKRSKLPKEMSNYMVQVPKRYEDYKAGTKPVGVK